MGEVDTPQPGRKVWWVIESSDLLAMLRRAHAGEDPELVYVEHYANSDHPDT